MEAPAELRALLLGYAGALVANGRERHTVAQAHVDANDGMRRAVADGIVQQIAKENREKPRIRADANGVVAFELERDVSRERGRCDPRNRVGDDDAQVALVALRARGFGLEAREREQLL